MSFQLSDNIDINKVFLVQRSALNERLDSEYYQPNHYQDLILLKNSPYRNDVLDRVCNRIVDGPFGSSIKASDYVERGIPFIRVADVTRGEGSIKTDDLIFITEEAHERIIRSKVIPNDVVIAKTGATMGAASLVPASIPEANIRGDLAVLSLNENDCIPRYVVIYINTNIGQRLFWRLDSGGTRGRVVIGNLKKYPIVIPPKNIQEEVIKKMDNAYALKKQKELEAKRSLDSIDDYLLGELGINLVEPEENTIKNRIFYRKLSEVSGGRFDSEYYHLSHYQDLVDLNKSSFNLKRLVEVCNKIVDGPFGSSIKAKDYVEKGIPFIRVADVTKGEGYLKTDELIFISDEAHQKILRSRVIPSDVVIAKTGATMGAACVVPENIPEANIRGDLAALTVKSEQCLPEYIVAFINTKIGQRLFWRLDSGGTRGRVVIGNLEKLPIVIPPLDIQRNIVKRVDKIRDRAKQLRQEAEADLEKAKQEVEAMILGIE